MIALLFNGVNNDFWYSYMIIDLYLFIPILGNGFIQPIKRTLNIF